MNDYPSANEIHDSTENESLTVDQDPSQKPIVQRISYGTRPQIREVESPIEETEEEDKSDLGDEEDQDEDDFDHVEDDENDVENQQHSMNSTPNTYKIFMDAILQRKESSFDSFQDWEQRREVKINTYLSICDNILEQIELRISASIDGTDGLLKFFANRRDQEEAYYTAAMKNLRPIGSLFSTKSLKGVGDLSFPKILREYDEYQQRQMKNSQDLASFIQNTIIKDTLLGQHTDSLKKLLTMRQKLDDGRKKIQEINKRIEKKGAKYSALVTQILNPEQGKSKKEIKDLYAKELSIVAWAQRQTEAYEAFGKVVLEFWEIAEAAENVRLASVQQALSLFVEKQVQVYGNSYGNPEILSKLLSEFNAENDVNKLFSARSLLTAEEIEYISKEMGATETEPLTDEDVLEFFDIFPFEPPLTKPLVLKEWEAQLLSGSFKSFKPCMLSVTVDGNLVIVDRSEVGVYKKAEAVIKFSQISLHEDEAEQTNPLILQIIETIPGLIFDSKRKHVIKFNTTDHVDEFSQYLSGFK